MAKKTKKSQTAFIMPLFIIIFVLLYGGLHFYMFYKARTALAFSTSTSFFVLLFMLVMVFAPILVRLSEKWGSELATSLIAYVGYTWMGILALFFCTSIVIDLLRFLVYLGGLISQRDFSSITHLTPYYFFAPLLLSILITTYGYFEARNIHTERVTIKTAKIPPEIGQLKIVQISDIHLGVLVGEERLKKILEEVKKANPDILVSTGDLVDGEMCNIEGLIRLLKEVNPRYGKFAVTGNHEFYAGMDKALDFTRNAGFTVLRGEERTVAGGGNVAGVDDPAGKPFGVHNQRSEKKLLSSLPPGNFTLFLKHRPVVNKDAVGFFDLQLSGHAHKGQIFPFSLITRLYYPIDEGYIKLESGSYLCVSKGAGTWGPPIRFMAPPDIVVIELIPEERH